MDIYIAKSIAFYAKNLESVWAFWSVNHINLRCFPPFMLTFRLKQRVLCHKPHKNNKNVLFHGKFMCSNRLNLQGFLPVLAVFMRFLTPM